MIDQFEAQVRRLDQLPDVHPYRLHGVRTLEH